MVNRLIFISMMAASWSAFAAPPLVPNFCAQAFCVALRPMVHSERRGFVDFDYDRIDVDGKSTLIFRYSEMGTVTIAGPFLGSYNDPAVNEADARREVRINACEQDGDSKNCKMYIISAEDNNISTVPMLCSVVAIWPAKSVRNTSYVTPGSPVVLDGKLSYRCW